MVQLNVRNIREADYNGVDYMDVAGVCRNNFNSHLLSLLLKNTFLNLQMLCEMSFVTYIHHCYLCILSASAIVFQRCVKLMLHFDMNLVYTFYLNI